MGETWVVLHSYIGNCPPEESEALKFRVPSDIPLGWAIFAWTWFPKMGPRDMYMNCAAVDIVEGNALPEGERTVFANRPETFVADTDDRSCDIEAFYDVEFPDPGPDLTRSEELVGFGSRPPICKDPST